ncbi:MAG: peptidase M22 [Eubacteriales bacterium]|nr:peptidase M22 [Eubacteriales bacterium]
MPKTAFIGIDTSCYTTSCAAVDIDGNILADERVLLSVKNGARGLRQSEAVFQHVRNFPVVFDKVVNRLKSYSIKACCVSKTPTDGENSYMPVFEAGKAFAQSLASALNIPCFYTTHQRGHMQAAILLDRLQPPFVAVHISGGTSDFMFIEHDKIETFAFSRDLHFGQLVDRAAVKIGLPFPGGSHLEKLAMGQKPYGRYSVTVKDAGPCLSGAEKQIFDDIEFKAIPKEQIAIELYDCLAGSMLKTLEKFNIDIKTPVLVFGGVASSNILRAMLTQKSDFNFRFSQNRMSSDNAVGVAIIGLYKYLKEGNF